MLVHWSNTSEQTNIWIQSKSSPSSSAPPSPLPFSSTVPKAASYRLDLIVCGVGCVHCVLACVEKHMFVNMYGRYTSVLPANMSLRAALYMCLAAQHRMFFLIGKNCATWNWLIPDCWLISELIDLHSSLSPWPPPCSLVFPFLKHLLHVCLAVYKKIKMPLCLDFFLSFGFCFPLSHLLTYAHWSPAPHPAPLTPTWPTVTNKTSLLEALQMPAVSWKPRQPFPLLTYKETSSQAPHRGQHSLLT